MKNINVNDYEELIEEGIDGVYTEAEENDMENPLLGVLGIVVSCESLGAAFNMLLIPNKHNGYDCPAWSREGWDVHGSVYPHSFPVKIIKAEAIRR